MLRHLNEAGQVDKEEEGFGVKVTWPYEEDQRLGTLRMAVERSLHTESKKIKEVCLCLCLHFSSCLLL